MAINNICTNVDLHPTWTTRDGNTPPPLVQTARTQTRSQIRAGNLTSTRTWKCANTKGCQHRVYKVTRQCKVTTLSLAAQPATTDRTSAAMKVALRARK